MKSIFVTEKSSVAEEYARILGVTERKDGYLESDRYIITWCVGHLVTMSYPEKYDEKLKKWSLDTLPFLPEDYLYEVIPKVAKQFNVIKKLYHRDDVTRIYYAGDSGEKEHIPGTCKTGSRCTFRDRGKGCLVDSQTVRRQAGNP